MVCFSPGGFFFNPALSLFLSLSLTGLLWEKIEKLKFLLLFEAKRYEDVRVKL